jgi:hypothetical protein
MTAAHRGHKTMLDADIKAEGENLFNVWLTFVREVIDIWAVN